MLFFLFFLLLPLGARGVFLDQITQIVCGCPNCAVQSLEIGCNTSYVAYNSTNSSVSFNYMGSMLSFVPSNVAVHLPSGGDCTTSKFFLSNGSTVIQTLPLLQIDSKNCVTDIAGLPLDANNPRLPGDFSGTLALRGPIPSQNVSVSLAPPSDLLFFGADISSAQSGSSVTFTIILANGSTPCCVQPASFSSTVGTFARTDDQEQCGVPVQSTYSATYTLINPVIDNSTGKYYSVNVLPTDESCGTLAMGNLLFLNQTFSYFVAGAPPQPYSPGMIAGVVTSAVVVATLISVVTAVGGGAGGGAAAALSTGVPPAAVGGIMTGSRALPPGTMTTRVSGMASRVQTSFRRTLYGRR